MIFIVKFSFTFRRVIPFYRKIIGAFAWNVEIKKGGTFSKTETVPPFFGMSMVLIKILALTAPQAA
jgi:hypothetical protein